MRNVNLSIASVFALPARRNAGGGRSFGVPGASPTLEPGESRLRAFLTLLAILVGPLVLLAVYDRLMFPGLTNADALDFAQLGRNLSEGRGFVTFVLRPLALTHGSSALHQPEITHGPLYPFLLALAFGAFGARDTVVAGMSGLFYLLTIPVVYSLGRRLVDASVGRIVALLFTINTLNLQYAASGLHLTLATLLMTGLFLALLHATPIERAPAGGGFAAPPTPARGALAVSGALSALLYLTDPLFFWAMPVTIGTALCLYPRQRGAALLWCAAPLLLLAAPWMLRNVLVTGDPLFGLRSAEIWMNTAPYPGYNAYRMLPDSFVPGVGLFLAVVNKILVSANQIVVTFPQVSAIWILAFFLPSLLFRLGEARARATRGTVLCSLFALFLTMLVFSVQMPLFTCLTPAMLIFAVAFLQGLLRQAQMPRMGRLLASGLIGVTMAYPLYSELAISDKPLPNRAAIEAKLLARKMGEGDACLSDTPWNVAWYANHPCAWLPLDDSEVGGVRQRIGHVDWLFLTDGTRKYSPAWQYVYGVFARWNLAALRAQSTRSAPPTIIAIKDAERPLMKALQGFASVTPDADTSPDIVIAHRTEMKSAQGNSHLPLVPGVENTRLSGVPPSVLRTRKRRGLRL